MANWLASVIKEGSKYSRYDSFRSSVCVFLDWVHGHSVRLADSPVIKSLSCGAASVMTRTPKYSECFGLHLIWMELRSWGPTDQLGDERLLAKTIMCLMIDCAARASDLARWPGWNVKSAGLLPAGSSWSNATEARLRFYLTKEVELALKTTRRRSLFSNVTRIRRIRARQVRNAELVDTFTCVAEYIKRHFHKLSSMSANSAEVTAASVKSFFLSVRPDRFGKYSFLSEDRISMITKSTMHAAGVDTKKFQAHAVRGEVLSTLRALGWGDSELTAISRHGSVAAMQRSYIREPHERVLSLRVDKTRVFPVEALRL